MTSDLLAENARLLKRMIAELEEALGVLPALPVTEHLLRAYEALQQRLKVPQ